MPLKDEQFYEDLIEKQLKMNNFEVFMRINSIYKELEEYSGTCSEEDRDFLVAYMMSGVMNRDDLENYDLVSSHHPELNLPDSSDY